MGAMNYRALYPDFELSLRRYGRSQTPFNDFFSLENSDKPYFKLLKYLESVYNKDKEKTLRSEVKIPRIIHQLWLGGDIPSKYQIFTDTWKTLSGWDYRFWTDKDLEEFEHPLLKEDIKIVEKSDILRLEILKKYGGVYADTDVRCLHGDFFEFANRQFSFYACIEPLEHGYIQTADDFYLRVGTALLGAVPEHPLITRYLDGMIQNHSQYAKHWPVTRTGPDLLTKILASDKKLLGKDGIVYPPTFFYPITCSHREAALAKMFIRKETVAVHYFDYSWGKEA